MTKAVVLSLGYDHFVIPAKAGMAGKLIELLSEAVPCRKDFSVRTGSDTYRIEPRRANVSVQIVNRDQILPPKKEDLDADDAIPVAALPGAVKLLKGGDQ